MRLVTLGTLGLILAASTYAQTTNPAKLKINGIGLDSTFAQVTKALGKPKKDGKATREECIGGREKTVDFDGATFYFMDGDSKNRKTFEVKSFAITSPKYSVSGIKVGDTEHNVRRRLGTKFTKSDDETGATIWTYEFPDPGSPGSTIIFISRGKVTKITSAHQVC
ncbi:MAG TPA: hypothetical protein PLK77_07695 [Pyrinomonadaceae bacterium]|nr:hypothetical protein [Pyrinomonadaceae bacterium]